MDSELVGSSNTMTRAPVPTAAAIWTICSCPVVSSPTGRSTSKSAPISDSIVRALDRISRRASRPPRKEIAEAEILGDGEIGAEGQFLMDHGQPETAGGVGIGRGDSGCLPLGSPAVRRVNTGEDLPKRAFPGPIFAHQGVAGSALDAEADVGEGVNAGKPFADALEGEKGHGAAGAEVGSAPMRPE